MDLLLVASPQLAALMVGDWLEETPVRGSLWFRCSVLRTVFSFVGRDIIAAPFRAGILALCALFLGSALSRILEDCWGIIMITLIRIDSAVRPPGILRPFPIHQWLTGPAETAILVIAVQFQIGVWIARHAPRREMTTCIFCVVVCIAAGMVSHDQVGSVLAQPYALLGWVSVIAGAIWVRRRRASVAAKVI